MCEFREVIAVKEYLTKNPRREFIVFNRPNLKGYNIIYFPAYNLGFQLKTTDNWDIIEGDSWSIDFKWEPYNNQESAAKEILRSLYPKLNAAEKELKIMLTNLKVSNTTTEKGGFMTSIKSFIMGIIAKLKSLSPIEIIGGWFKSINNLLQTLIPDRLLRFVKALSHKRAFMWLLGLSGIGAVISLIPMIKEFIKGIFPFTEEGGFIRKVLSKIYKIIHKGVDIVKFIGIYISGLAKIVYEKIKNFGSITIDKIKKLLGFKVVSEEEILK